MSKEHKALYETTMRLKIYMDAFGNRNSPGAQLCMNIMFDITSKLGGSTANDIANLSGMPYSSVHRYLQQFAENGFITYGQVSTKDRKNYVHLTEKGEALRMRLSYPMEDPKAAPFMEMQAEAQLQSMDRAKRIQDIMDAAEKMAETGVAQPVHYKMTLEAPVTARVEVGKATVHVQDADGNPKSIKDALAIAKSPKAVKQAIEQFGAAQDEHVITQVLRAVRSAASAGSQMVKWRDVPINIIDPEACVHSEKEDGAERIQNNGVWMLYPKGANPATTLPMAVQADMPKETFDQLIKARTDELTSYEIAGLSFGDVTLASTMQDLKVLLNERQYNKARTEITAAVADFSQQMKAAKAEHEEFAKQQAEKARTAAKAAEQWNAHANIGALSMSERMDARRLSNQMAKESVEAEAARQESEAAQRALEARLEEVAQAAADRDRERDQELKDLRAAVQQLLSERNTNND